MTRHHPCDECGAAVTAGKPVRRTRVGRYKVDDDSRAGPVCANGHAELDLDELAEYERRAAIAVLSEAADIGGDEIRFARKSLGFTQARLARLLDVAPETVSRWETGSETMSRVSRLALLAVVNDAGGLARIERGDGARTGEALRVNAGRQAPDWRPITRPAPPNGSVAPQTVECLPERALPGGVTTRGRSAAWSNTVRRCCTSADPSPQFPARRCRFVPSTRRRRSRRARTRYLLPPRSRTPRSTRTRARESTRSSTCRPPTRRHHCSPSSGLSRPKGGRTCRCRTPRWPSRRRTTETWIARRAPRRRPATRWATATQATADSSSAS